MLGSALWRTATLPEVRERLARLDVPFNALGIDPYGISKEHIGTFMSGLRLLHANYFRIRSFGIHNVPDVGAAMLIGNHSGGLPADASMVIASVFFDKEPPRLVHGMVEKFAQNWPVVSPLFMRVGQFPGLPEHALRLLGDGRLLMVFPEGARGTGKLYRDRYQMVRFGTGFLRVALQAGVPIVPFCFIGGEEALPTVFHAQRLAKMVGAPYWPVPPYLLPVPLPVPCEIHFGEPLRFDGNGDEPDELVDEWVEQVRSRIEDLISQGRRLHGHIDRSGSRS